MQQQTQLEPMDIEISVPKKGIILKEKSVIAVRREDGEVLSVGNKAVQAPYDEKIVKRHTPLHQGNVVDYDNAEKMMTTLIGKAAGTAFSDVRVRMGLLVPSNLEEQEISLYADMLKKAGAHEVLVLSQDTPLDELEREEEKCKVIVTLKNPYATVEQ